MVALERWAEDGEQLGMNRSERFGGHSDELQTHVNFKLI